MLDPTVPLLLPRLPVLGWQTFAGLRRATLPCLTDLPHVAFTTSGRAAIAWALRALRIGRGDAVLVPTYHCPTMIAPVVAAGAAPLFYPIDAAAVPALETIEALDLGAVKAFLVPHFFGLPQPMARIRSFCDERGIALIEDCAHAMFGMADGRPIGAWGDYAIGSVVKFFPVSEGGVLASNTRPLDNLPGTAGPAVAYEGKALLRALELGALHQGFPGLNGLLRSVFSLANRVRGTEHAIPRGDTDRAPGPAETARWLADFAPGTPAQHRAARFTRAMVRSAHRGRIVAARRRNYGALGTALADLPGARPLVPSLPEGAVPYVFPLWVDAPEATYQKVRGAGVPVFRWDEVWPGTSAFASDAGRAWATHAFQLGCHQDLSPADIEAMAAVLHDIFALGAR